MSSERDDRAAKRAIVATMVVAILSLIMLLCMGCKSARDVPPVVEYRTETKTDTLREKDSVYVYRYIYTQGDTVHDKQIEYRDRWRERLVEVVKIDSVPYPVEVVREVPRERSGYDRFTSWFTWIVIAAILLYIILRVLVRFGGLKLPRV